MSTKTKGTILLSFHGDEAIKEKYLAKLRAHRIADEIIQGVTFEKTGKDSGKGCAIGCTLDKYDHAAFETELGIPRVLARLEDRIFEGLSVEESKDFPINFLSAIPVGKDLSKVFKKILIWMLVDATDGVIKFAKTVATKEAITNVAALITRALIEKVTSKEFEVVRQAALEARRAADAAAYAADAAYAAYAADAAYDDAADAAAYAAYAAYDDDAAASAASASAASARKKYYSKMATKLIELLKAA